MPRSRALLHSHLHSVLRHRRRAPPELVRPVGIVRVDRALRDLPQQIVEDRDLRPDRGENHDVIRWPRTSVPYATHTGWPLALMPAEMRRPSTT